jgi:hypothetical protein
MRRPIALGPIFRPRAAAFPHPTACALKIGQIADGVDASRFMRR